ncbi:hypothetical protein JYG23_04995 [Sedimentibacter sp. zth1]|uniref:hypothetical protein n=1 Tax=Sedimentibacter sp. zth1 TaxID=2816908 RepID=UPI001A91DFA3|nr:hypothetical protein [Sedimentibacter sp. zth1]QSX06808.1 hypothetical protein JYG23_04995 [Sedimentibacter sp. zth1]
MIKTNKNSKHEQNKQLLFLTFVLLLSLILSAFIFFYVGQEELVKISYNSIQRYTFLRMFLEIFKRNIIYFVVITIFAFLGKDKFVYFAFVIFSLYFGLSMIYITKVFSEDKLYLLLNIPDYLLYFPLVFYFTHICILIAKYIKKIKKVETKRNKLDIIIIEFMKIAVIFLLIVGIYSCVYSCYIYFILN